MQNEIYEMPWEPLNASLAQCRSMCRMWETWWTRFAGGNAVDAARRRRLDALVSFARRGSAFYRAAYRGLPQRALECGELPVVTKPRLMAHFDEWVTDPLVTLAGVTAFLQDRKPIGARYLERHVIWKSSGSTGEPGIYVQDADALATFDALMGLQLDPMRFLRSGPLTDRRSGKLREVIVAMEPASVHL